MFSNGGDFLAGISTAPPRLVLGFGKMVQRVVTDMHQGACARTPVHTGEALANMQWSMDHEDGEVFPAQGSGPTGATNSMALGTEPRRAENQAMADHSLHRLSFTMPFHRYIFQNNSLTAGPLESGIWPLAPFRQRSPQGMFAVTMAEVAARLQGGYYHVS